MAAEVGNHTIKLLQDMRSEMRDVRTEIRETRADLTGRIDGLTTRADGHAILLERVAGLVSNHHERITRLERDRV